MIEWITQILDHENREILNFEDKSVANYKASVLNQLYHFKEAHVKVTAERLKQKNGFADFLTTMKGWWSEGQLRANPSVFEWKTPKSERAYRS